MDDSIVSEHHLHSNSPFLHHHRLEFFLTFLLSRQLPLTFPVFPFITHPTFPNFPFLPRFLQIKTLSSLILNRFVFPVSQESPFRNSKKRMKIKKFSCLVFYFLFHFSPTYFFCFSFVAFFLFFSFTQPFCQLVFSHFSPPVSHPPWQKQQEIRHFFLLCFFLLLLSWSRFFVVYILRFPWFYTFAKCNFDFTFKILPVYLFIRFFRRVSKRSSYHNL